MSGPVAITCNSVDDSIRTIANNLNAKEVALIEVGVDFLTKVQEIKPSFVYNFFNGLRSLHSSALVPLVLDELGIPFLGLDTLSSALCSDKVSMRSLLVSKIRMPSSSIITNVDQISRIASKPPYIVKPDCGTDAESIYEANVIKVPNALIPLCDAMLDSGLARLIIEEFVPGREVSVFFFNQTCLGTFEIKFGGLMRHFKIFGTEAREFLARNDFRECLDIPAFLQPQALNRLVIDTAQKAAFMLGMSGFYSVDIRINNQMPFVIDIGPLSPKCICSDYFKKLTNKSPFDILNEVVPNA